MSGCNVNANCGAPAGPVGPNNPGTTAVASSAFTSMVIEFMFGVDPSVTTA